MYIKGVIYIIEMSIYIIRSKDLSLHDCYIGSCKDINRRRLKHKNDCYNEKGEKYNLKVYKFIRDNGGWNDWDMVQIGSVWNKATKLLFQIEQDYIDQYKPSLNRKRAFGLDYERKKQRDILNYYNNRECKKEQQKKRYEKNKHKILVANKEKFTCECGSTIRISDKQRHNRSKKHQKYLHHHSHSPLP